MNRAALLFVASLLASCVTPPPVTASPAATESPPPSPAPGATATPALTANPTVLPTPAVSPASPAKPIAGVGARAVLSPNGKLLAVPEAPPGGKVPYVPAALVYDLEGKLVRRVEAPGGTWRWLPDSSGLFVALDAPQRSSQLGTVDLATGTARDTGLQMAGASLSRDGTWILADHQEGCCMDIEQREIWIAPRTGGTAKVFVRSNTERQQPMGIVGVDAQDRLVYRDDSQVFRMAVAGGTPQLLGTLASAAVLGNEPGFTEGDASPDGTVMLMRTYDPLRWYVVANDRVTMWSDAIGSIIEDKDGIRLQYYASAVWAGAHAVLVRSSSGELASLDLVTGGRASYRASLAADDVALAYDAGRLLVARGRRALLIDLSTGETTDAGIDIGTDSVGALGAGLPTGGFILSTATATYRID